MLADAFVTLKNGPTLPVPAVSVALDLETRGFTLRVEGEKLMVSGPMETLTEADKGLIRQWKPHLLAIVGYCESGAAHG